jgi:hypothetical protein
MTKTVTVKGDRKAALLIEQMLAEGWELVSHNSRRQVASMHHGGTLLLPIAGVFTAKQKHTLTFTKEGVQGGRMKGAYRA